MDCTLNTFVLRIDITNISIDIGILNLKTDFISFTSLLRYLGNSSKGRGGAVVGDLQQVTHVRISICSTY